MKKVYLTENIHKDAVAYLSENFEVVQGVSKDPADIIAAAQGCEAVLIRSAEITEEIMDKVPTLKVIAKHGIGVDNINIPAATARGMLIVNAPHSNINAVAEHAVALIYSAAKHMVLLDKITREGGFAKRNQYVNLELSGKTVGFVGLGKIAKLTAKKLTAMDVNMIAYDPYANADDAKALGVTLVSLDEVLTSSDFVSLHTPLMDATHKMINKETLGKMKKSAWLINVARGPIVDEVALVEALKEGVIAGAALDVFDPEPPKADCPLFELDNVIVSPHNAALTDNALLAMAMDSATGITDYLLGRKPQFPVNPEVLK